MWVYISAPLGSSTRRLTCRSFLEYLQQEWQVLYLHCRLLQQGIYAREQSSAIARKVFFRFWGPMVEVIKEIVRDYRKTGKISSSSHTAQGMTLCWRSGVIVRPTRYPLPCSEKKTFWPFFL